MWPIAHNLWPAARIPSACNLWPTVRNLWPAARIPAICGPQPAYPQPAICGPQPAACNLWPAARIPAARNLWPAARIPEARNLWPAARNPHFSQSRINNILFGQKKPWKYRCLIEIIEWGFCSDDRLANEQAGQRQLWRHDGYLLYFDDHLANEHDGHNDYDAMLYGSGVINSDLTANQNDRYIKLRYSVQVGEFPCYKWRFISL